MSKINLLNDDTINKIAAGEVVENPKSVVKELVENSIDAGASAITIEIRSGGISFIRVTDNGEGIVKEDIKKAFLRHSTSKIKTAKDLEGINSLGFRGEALASIAAVSGCELITATEGSLAGNRYFIEGGIEKAFEEVGVPVGTTIVVRDLFFNTPARKKFLKSPSAEGASVIDAALKLAISHPDISFHVIADSKTKLHTSGNGSLKEVLYAVYGKDAANNLLPVNAQNDMFHAEGFAGKPVLSRGNRSYELFEVNGRTIKSPLLSKAAEEAYHGLVMQHKYPFFVLKLNVPADFVDVNVHPAKLEVRFSNEELIYNFVREAVLKALLGKELIAEQKVSATEEILPEQKEQKKEEAQTDKYVSAPDAAPQLTESISFDQKPQKMPTLKAAEPFEQTRIEEFFDTNLYKPAAPDEETGFERQILTPAAEPDFKLIGSVFDTYILIEYKDEMLLIDQHAAHEKVLYERFMKDFKNHEHTSQHLDPPLVLTLSERELQVLFENEKAFTEIGYEIEAFGGRDVAVYAVPGNLYDIAKNELLIEMLDDLADDTGHGGTTAITDRIATMSCKAAVKGSRRLDMAEAQALIKELLTCKNPYTCPHGRPTTIVFSKYELDKRFKRIL